MNAHSESSQRNIYSCIFVVASGVAFWVPLQDLVHFAVSHDYGSHILLIVPLAILLIYLKRQTILSVQANPNRRRKRIAGASLFLSGLIFLVMSKYQPLSAEKLSLEISSLVILWISGFVFCYGGDAFTKAQCPLLFLFLLVPIPELVIDKTICALQAGSSDVAYGLLRLLNVPVLKEGYILQLPVVNLEVAKECSGIRSSIALLVTTIVAGEFVLQSGWRKLLFVASVIPILVIKNGVRIVTIYLLTAYVNPAFLRGWLHTSGGIVFYLLGLVALIPVAVLLRRWEKPDLTLSPMHELAH